MIMCSLDFQSLVTGQAVRVHCQSFGKPEEGLTGTEQMVPL